MKYIISLFVLLLSFIPLFMHAQHVDLATHRWKDRLIVILTDQSEHPLLQTQLAELATQTNGLRERKLVVYQFTPTAYRCQLAYAGKWQAARGTYTTLKRTKSSFEVLLIGLDGRVKLRQTSPVTCDTFFELIDQMPMRRTEIRRAENQ